MSVCGAIMPISGGAGTTPCNTTLPLSRCARQTGFSHRVGVSSVYLAPALLALPFAENGGAWGRRSLSLRLSKHTPSVKESSNWSRKKSPILGMCSDPPRYYNLINRQAGRPLKLPPPRAARLFSCLWRRFWALWTGPMQTFTPS